MLVYNGVEYTLEALSNLTGIPTSTLSSRQQRGITGQDLVKKVKQKRVRLFGNLLNLRQVADRSGIPYNTIRRRYRDGLRGERLINPNNLNLGKLHDGFKLTHEQVREIFIAAHNGDLSQDTIAEEYEVHQSTVSDIKRGKRWRLITQDITVTNYTV